MQGTVAELIRELMETQQLSVRKVSARIAEKHGGSVYGYTQQVSRLLNDPTYDPTLSTVQKIFSALNVSLWQIGSASDLKDTVDAQLLTRHLEKLSADVAELKLELVELRKTMSVLAEGGRHGQKG